MASDAAGFASFGIALLLTVGQTTWRHASERRSGMNTLPGFMDIAMQPPSREAADVKVSPGDSDHPLISEPDSARTFPISGQ
jgi:hypothetical protein